MPRDDAWLSRPKLGVSRRQRVAVQRVVHLCVAALNYMYLGAPFASLDGLRRRPGPNHVGVYKRLEVLVKAGGPSGEFFASGCGRKSFQLDARLKELQKALQRLGLSKQFAYGAFDEVEEVPLVNDKDELRPYRSLDPAR
eukprot:s620_g21.t1